MYIIYNFNIKDIFITSIFKLLSLFYCKISLTAELEYLF